MKKKTVSLLLVVCMILSCVISVGFSASAEDIEIAGVSAEDYGLPDNCEDGNILHCFNWTLSQIKQELPNIAAAGFTSVQTSPLQGHDGSGKWYWLYQPTGFSIGNEIGSYNDLKSLCTEADKYGIKVIVDVVANHLAGSNSGSWANSVESNLKQSKYYHNLGPKTSDDDRYEVTQKNIGMPDLNSENADIQNMVASMVVRLKEAGVDGIRWDAAKHIALPSENCGFWSRMAQIDIYQYGEILDAPAGNSPDSINVPLMNEYEDFMDVTDSKYSTDLMSAVRNGGKYNTDGYWNKRDIAAENIVYWGESHDTYSNNNGWTKNIDQNLIDRAYAVLGARAGSKALYLSRPFETNHESIRYATKGSTHFTSAEVAAVNHFHNAMLGTNEKYTSSTKYYAVLRERGAVIALTKGSDTDVSVSNSGGLVAVGTYVDEVSGNTFTVTETKITGHVGSTGIAVIYDGETPPEEKGILGDVDCDEEVTIIDATVIQRIDAEIPLPFTPDERAADADEDGYVTIIDATFIQRWLIGLKSNDNIGKPIT